MLQVLVVAVVVADVDVAIETAKLTNKKKRNVRFVQHVIRKVRVLVR